MPNTKKQKIRTALTPREFEFVGAYRGSVIKAARLIGMERRNAFALMKRPRVKAAIQEKANAAIAESGQQLGKDLSVNAANVLKELARLAFSDPRKFFNENGSAKPVTELDDDTAMALAGFEMIEQFEGSGDDRKFTGYLKKFKISDKGQNLERLLRYLESSGQLLPRETVRGSNVYRALQTTVLQRVTETITQTKEMSPPIIAPPALPPAVEILDY